MVVIRKGPEEKDGHKVDPTQASLLRSRIVRIRLTGLPALAGSSPGCSGGQGGKHQKSFDSSANVTSLAHFIVIRFIDSFS